MQLVLACNWGSDDIAPSFIMDTQINEVVMPNFEGGCLCRSIRYRLAGEPMSSIICHCVTCRKSSAAPMVAWLTLPRVQFEFLRGSPQIYLSSRDVVRRFCGQCGTPLTYENGSSPNTIDVTTASLDEPNAFPPSMETWLEHRLGWQPANESLGHFGRGAQEI